MLRKLTKYNVQVKKLQRNVQTQKHVKNICFVTPKTECYPNIITIVIKIMILIRAYDNYVAAHGAGDDAHNHFHLDHHDYHFYLEQHHYHFYHEHDQGVNQLCGRPRSW